MSSLKWTNTDANPTFKYRSGLYLRQTTSTKTTSESESQRDFTLHRHVHSNTVKPGADFPQTTLQCNKQRTQNREKKPAQRTGHRQQDSSEGVCSRGEDSLSNNRAQLSPGRQRADIVPLAQGSGGPGGAVCRHDSSSIKQSVTAD